MPPERPLPTSILAALGLMAGTACGPCLSPEPPKTTAETGDTGTYSPCLTAETSTIDTGAGGTGDTSTTDTGSGDTSTTDTGTTDTGTGASAAAAGSHRALLERLAIDVLPADVAQRLLRED